MDNAPAAAKLPHSPRPRELKDLMKAEHRHELKTNDLSKALITTGDYVKEYGGRVALALAIVIMVVVLVNTRIKRGRESQARLKSNLAFAQAQIDQLEMIGLDPLGVPTAPPSRFDEVRADLDTILDDASDKQVLAQALVARGDLNWALANYPQFPPGSPATTRPAYKLEKERSEYLKDAASAYQQVLDRYADQTLPSIVSRFGLATVAEQGRQWEQARAHYEQLAKLPDEHKTFKQLADARLKRLDELGKPILIGQVPDKPELPPLPEPDPFDLDRPSTTRPGVSATGAATQPATRPAATRPTTR
jgi:tetratricopeptide (TPR) repeat protein